MIIGIDASNLRAGGGITHLRETLARLEPEKFGIDEVIVWGGKDTLALLPRGDRFTLSHQPILDRSLPFRFLWQLFSLSRLARELCDILFVPGGSYLGDFHPFVTMSRNMLPFEKREVRRYGLSTLRLKLFWLRISQLATMRRSDGIIFLNTYAESRISSFLDRDQKQKEIIPHGIDRRFFREPVDQKHLKDYSDENPLQLLYVSHIENYKHQWGVIEGVAALRQQGIPVKLTLAGRMGNAARRYQEARDRFDPDGEFVHYLGEVDYADLEKVYHGADIFIYASTVENLPNTLLEAMASGLPIACSNYGPMPGVLRDAGLYFDPEKPQEITRTLSDMIQDPTARQDLARRAFMLAADYSWQKCAEDTYRFLTSVAAGE
ncbi:MAG: glycosyltransferase family 1 protein [Chloroflexota bacterium]|nr:MAG: glycosyltransferase family 1 protein [Chloroflexota bacterium]HDD62165.1 glycosyltransferase family 1 protein [Chloroflexota bacterium]